MRKSFDPKTFLWHRLNVKLTLLFLLVGLVAPTIGIGYFYLIAHSFLADNPELFAQQQIILNGAALLIILLIAGNTTLLGLVVSRSFTKPLQELHKATHELEKGNFSIRTNIHTNDELAQLGDAFNKTTFALGKMQEEHLQLEKAKSEFLSITSHELRTPITPLKAQLQMLQEGYFGHLTEKQSDSLKVVLRNVERLNKIIEDFLEVSRIEAARLKFVFRQTDLRDLIQETIGLMDGFAREKQITLQVSTGELPIIDADPDRISQVLRNLVHNAIKFSPNNSVVQLHAEVKKEFVCFSVNDQGVGLSAEDQLRVFEPFYQVDGALSRPYGGTGLGLTICRGIIEAQKGKIWVESTVGFGSTFYFTVPLEPVQEIEPIKVLFSQKTDIEQKLREEFTIALGPMGVVEFDELKNKHALGREDLYEYITTLEESCILRRKSADEFKRSINRIFGWEPYPKEKGANENRTYDGKDVKVNR